MMSHDICLSVGDDDIIIIIGSVVGGVVAGAVLLILILLCVCLCVHRMRTGQVDFNKQGKESEKVMEMGQIRQRMEPQVGSDHYRAVCSYQPQDTGSGTALHVSHDGHVMIM